MRDSERVYGNIVVEAKNPQDMTPVRAERTLPGCKTKRSNGKPKKTYLVADNPAARPMTQYQCERLASQIEETLGIREERWEKERTRGRTPGASRPANSASVRAAASRSST